MEIKVNVETNAEIPLTRTEIILMKKSNCMSWQMSI